MMFMVEVKGHGSVGPLPDAETAARVAEKLFLSDPAMHVRVRKATGIEQAEYNAGDATPPSLGAKPSDAEGRPPATKPTPPAR